jgi:hypothetical protein
LHQKAKNNATEHINRVIGKVQLQSK